MRSLHLLFSTKYLDSEHSNLIITAYPDRQKLSSLIQEIKPFQLKKKQTLVSLVKNRSNTVNNVKKNAWKKILNSSN